MTLSNKRIFVSGGAGVIGQELIKKLHKSNSILFVGDLKNRPSEFPPNIFYRRGDLNMLKFHEIEVFKPDIFIHLAATFERSVETYDFWEENFQNNINLSHHLLSLIMNLESIQKIIFASSYLVYDPNQYLYESPQAVPFSLTEHSNLHPRNLTGSAKLMHESELDFLSSFKSDQISVIIARIFRGYGKNSRDVISRWIRSLIKNEEIEVFNSQNIFDFIYSEDTAEALKKLAESSNANGIINLGSGRSRSIDDILAILKTHFPDMVHNKVDSSMKFEASQAVTDQLKSQINWLPQHTLEDAIPKIINFEKSRKHTDDKALMVNVLVTSSSKKIPLLRSMQEALDRIDCGGQVFAGDLSKKTLSSYVSDFFWNMPATSHKFTNEIIQGCLDRNINIIFPTRDGELSYWAKNKQLFFESGIHVVVPSENSLKLTLDKLLFFKFGSRHGFNMIPTSININDINATHYVVKPRFGSGGKNIGIKLTKELAISKSLGMDDPIFQPYVEGDEISVDAWSDCKGKVKGLVLRRRSLIVDGESQVSETFRHIQSEELVKSFLETMKLTGPSVIQLIVDSSGRLHFLECNPRFGGASTTSLAVGLDSLYWSLLEILNSDLIDFPFSRSSREARLTRVPVDSIEYHDSNF